MPFHLAIFGANKADAAMAQHDYEQWYIGGHSLGGAKAANYAADRGDQLTSCQIICAICTIRGTVITDRSVDTTTVSTAYG